MVIRLGKNGAFLACCAYPECKTTLNYKKNDDGEIIPITEKEQVETVDEQCEKCGKQLVMRQGRFGKFLACSAYPECKFTRPIKKEVVETEIKCPQKGCDGMLIKRRGRRGKPFYGCSAYPKCKFTTTTLKGLNKDNGDTA